jgi:hypothetical protein
VDEGAATEESIDEVLLNIGLSEAYLRIEPGKSDATEADGRRSPASDPDPHPEGFSKDGQAKTIAAAVAGRQKNLAKYRKEEETLLEGIRVNQPLFFR